MNPLDCVSLPGYTWQCGLKSSDNKLETIQEKDMIYCSKILSEEV